MKASCHVAALFTAMTILAACGNDLSRGKAEASLIAYANATPLTMSIQVDEVLSKEHAFKYSREEQCWRQLAEKRVASEPAPSSDPVKGRYGSKHVRYQLTLLDPTNVVQVKSEEHQDLEWTAPVSLATVVRSRRQILSVDGISRPAPALSVVKFNYEERPTGFDSPACYDYGTRALSVGAMAGTAAFSLYDDGWRLEKVQW